MGRANPGCSQERLYLHAGFVDEALATCCERFHDWGLVEAVERRSSTSVRLSMTSAAVAAIFYAACKPLGCNELSFAVAE